MVSASTEELYCGNMIKRSLDNGYIPQWKLRKVSAIRDFPPGCGPNSVAIHSETAGNGGNGERTVNVTVRVGVDCCKIADGDATEIPKFCNTQVSGMDGVEELTLKTRHRGTEFTATVDCELHEAISDPIEADTAESLNSRVGTLTVMALEGSLKDAEDFIITTGPLRVGLCNDLEGAAFDNMPEDGGQTTVDELNEAGNLKLLQNSMFKGKPVLDAGAASDEVGLSGPSHTSSSPKGLNVSGRVELETIHRPKDKYRRRRVSAVRDFPPLCGTNAQPTKVEQRMFTCENDYPDEVKRGMVISRNYFNGEELGEMLKTSECLDWADNVDLKSETMKNLSYDSGREPLGEKLIGGAGKSGIQGATRANMEAGPKSFKESNGGLKDLKIKKAEETQAVPVSSNMAKAPLHRERKVAFVNLEGVTRKGEAALVNSDTGTRKGNVALVSSEGGTRTGKVRKQLSSWPRESIGFTSKSDLMADCTGPSVKKTASVSSGADGRLVIEDEEHHGAYDHLSETTQNFMSQAVFAGSDEDPKVPKGKEVAVHASGSSNKMRPTHGVLSLVDEADRKVVHGMVAAPYGTWKKAKVGCGNSDRGKERKQFFWGQHKFKAFAKKSYAKSTFLGGASIDHNVVQPSVADGSPGALILSDKRGYGHEAHSPHILKHKGFKAILPPFGPKSSGHGDARKRVRETLRFFHAVCRKLLHEEEVKSMDEQREKSRQPKKGSKRIDLRAANHIKNEGKEVNTGKILGEVPGVQVGDEFQYRVELAVVGIHRLYQNGIDSIKLNGKIVATSIVASGAYADDMESGDILIYSGQGGNVVEKDKEPEDQKLEKGNLALKNSISANTPVRVVRGWKVKTADSKTVPVYVYDGLYTVKQYWMETGPHGKLVFMFELWRNPGQPELAWKELKRSDKSKTRTGVCVNDISGGKEPFPICAVNILDNEKPPPFNYISKMMYPDWYHPIAPKGCDCTGRCSDPHKCQCAAKNGGQIPYNRNGAIVEIKPLVYECGPSCGCPPSCYNRVSQRGIKFELEIFKTESRGWGIRSLNSIPSGSFICEYSGELLQDREAEKRVGEDEYLFDIGHNFNMPGEQATIVDYGEAGFTIDAARYGNVGRFINHSCSPNLYAQNVVYDHDDKRMPHVMLFVTENIPPLQELTFNYNYKVGQVCDSNGNIKTKKCFCGASECRGRMY